MKLEHRSFEGKFWTLYFKQQFEQNEEDVKKLFDEYRSILRFQDKDPYEWYSTFCLAQETFARELRSRLFFELQDQFSYLDKLGNDNFLNEIETGSISIRIKNYQNKVSDILSRPPYIKGRAEILENKLLPFIDHYNQVVEVIGGMG